MVARTSRPYYRMSLERPPAVTVALASASALAFEILLIRLLAVVQWHHLAFLVISLALLGYGASGSWIALFPRASREGYDAFFHLSALGLAVSLWCSTQAALKVPFNLLEILWRPSQWGLLALMILLLSIPFFFVGTLIGLCLRRFDRRAHSVYAADLFGAGAGSLAAIGLLYVWTPMKAVNAVVCLAALGALTARIERPSRIGTVSAAAAVAGAALIAFLPESGLPNRLSPYKPLSQALIAPDARVTRELTSPMGWVAVAESPTVPFRIMPGASLLAAVEPPEQKAVFTDAGGPDALTRYEGRRASLAYLDQTTPALAFHLEPRPERVLLPMAGVGETALLAHYHNARQVDALELDPRKIDLIRTIDPGFSGWRFLEATIRYHPAEMRGFLATTSDSYDLILLPPVGAGTGPGTLSLKEDYTLTVEAFRAAIRRLASGGLFSVSWWLRLPPREGLRLADTALSALAAEGEPRPSLSLAVIRSWRTGTLVIRKGGLTGDDVAAIRRFCRDRAFDPVFFPGIAAEEVNRHTVLRSPILHSGVLALAGEERNAFLRHYKFAVGAVSDDRPFFHFFFKWEGFSELMTMGAKGSTVLSEWGYPLVLLALAVALVLSVTLVLLPLAFRQRFPGRLAKGGWREVVYFAGIGVGFITLEIVYIQMGIRLLHHPVVAAAAVLSGFLVFAGLGSRFSQRLAAAAGTGKRPIAYVMAGIALGAVCGITLLGLSPDRFPVDGLLFRVALVLLASAPAAFFMGMPFPLGLARLSRTRPDWIPWAWGINGFASVNGAVLATLLALHMGFFRVFLVSLTLYGVAAWAGAGASGGSKRT